jgi:hypothetical protein
MRKAWFVLGGFALGAVTMALLRPKLAPLRGSSVAPVSLAERELDRVVSRIDLDAVPFDRAVQDIQKLTPAPIVLERAELAAIHFDRKTPITMHGVDIPLGDILTRLTSLDGKRPAIGFQVSAGEIVITSRPALNRTLMVRCYDVRDLIAQKIWLENDEPFNGQMGPVYRETIRAQSLVDIIEATVSPNLRKTSGGTIDDAYYFNGRLFVAQSWAGQRAVRKMLRQFAAPEPPQSPIVNQPWSDLRKEWVFGGATRAQETMIHRPISHIDLDHVSIEAAIDSLRKQSGAPIWIDRKELPKESIERIGPISLHLDHVPLSHALDALTLQPTGDTRFGYTVEDGVILITSQDKASSIRTTRLYDVRDLPSGPLANNPYPYGELMALIEDTVGEDTWKDKGGIWQTIYEFNGRLLVTQSWQNQEAVGDFLEGLRKGGTKFDPPPRVPNPPNRHQ